MTQSIRNAALVSALAVAAFVAIPATASHADGPDAVYGIVERLPGSPDLVGEWSVGGRTLTVDRHTRLEASPTPTAGYWRQTASGVVLRAPGWSADAALAAGFRKASTEELVTFRPGRVVKAKVQPGAAGQLVATKIELGHDLR